MQNKLQKILKFGLFALAVGIFQIKPANASLLKYYPNVVGTNWNQALFTTTTDWAGTPAKYAINYSSSTGSGAYLASKPTGADCLKLRSYDSGQVSASSTRTIESDGRYTDYYLAGSEYYSQSVTLGQSWGANMGIALMDSCGVGTSGGANFANGDLDLYIFDSPTDTIQGASPAPTPVLNFIFPTASSSVPLFSDFLLSAQNLNDNEGYQVRLQYYLTDDYSTTTKLAGVRGQTDWTGFAYGIGADFETKGVRISRPNFGIDWATDNAMHVAAQLYASQDPNNPNADLAQPIMVASTSIAFILEAIPTNGGIYITPRLVASSTAPYGFVASTSTRPIGAVEAPTLGDYTDCSLIPFTDTYTGINIPFLASTAADRLMCELKSTANNWIADMGEFGNGTIETLLNLVNSVFPINVFSHINNDIDLARNATTTFTGDVVISGPNLFAGRSMKIISASGTAAALETLGGGEDSNFPIKSLFDKILYLITGGIILLVSAWEIKSLRDA